MLFPSKGHWNIWQARCSKSSRLGSPPATALGFHRSGGSAGPLVFANTKNPCNISAAGRGARGGQGGTSASLPTPSLLQRQLDVTIRNEFRVVQLRGIELSASGISSLSVPSPPKICRFYFTSRKTEVLFSVFPPVFLTGC